jgi:DegV family protein with EDD domain
MVLDAEHCPLLLAGLRDVVVKTAELLPYLRSAGVVDAGALGMYVFFDGFLRTLCGYRQDPEPLFELFPGLLKIGTDFDAGVEEGYCVDTLIRLHDGRVMDGREAGALGESVVVLPEDGQVKLHVHTDNPRDLWKKISTMGEIVRWSDEKLANPARSRDRSPKNSQCIHIMTDGAGSISRQLALDNNITLLDSYIVAGEDVRPESLCAPETIYRRLASGGKVTTAQASNMERHQFYNGVCEQFGRTLYLAVGSAFTGNHATDLAWKEQASRGKMLDLVDTGAASGRLAVIALLTARYAGAIDDPDEVVRYTRRLCDQCREYVFIDCLRYLVAGGRVSRAGGFFGDLLHMKPVITPTGTGVQKLGVVRSREGQLRFLTERMQNQVGSRPKLLVLLQYSDNRQWVVEVVRPLVEKMVGGAEILLQPLSLTSGVHMGPGTWSVAFGPEEKCA